MLALASWLVGSKAGRIAFLVLAALSALTLALVQAYSRGKASERLAQTQHRLDALMLKVKTDEALRRLSPRERRERLARWVRPQAD